MGPSLHPSSVTVLSNAAYEHHQHPCSTDEEQEDDEFEFRPLLPPPRHRIAHTARHRPCRRVAAHVACKVVVNNQPPSSQRAPRSQTIAAAAKVEAPPRRLRWHHMAFGSVRVPSAMDMGEIRRRLKARQAAAAAGSAPNEPSSAADGWAPWRLIRSLSCRGVEAVAVAAAAAPVRLV